MKSEIELLFEEKTIEDLSLLTGQCDDSMKIILRILFDSVRDGNLSLPLQKELLLSKFNEVIKESSRSTALVDELFEGLKRDRYSELISNNAEEMKPLVLTHRDDGREFIAFQRYAAVDSRLSEGFRTMLEEKFGEHTLPDNKLIDSEKLKLFFSSTKNSNLEQESALVAPLFNRLTLISGGPGTGKTYIISKLINLLHKLGVAEERIIVGAPTGRAAYRITECIRNSQSVISDDRAKIDIEAQTIHRILNYSPSSNSFGRNEKVRLDADFVIIDEAGMIDAFLMDALLKALPDSSRLILIGDKDQLSPVGCGSSFSWLCDTEKNIVILKKNYRMGSAVAPAAEAVRDGKKADDLLSLFTKTKSIKNEDEVSKMLWIDSSELNEKEIAEILKEWMELYFGNGQSSYIDEVDKLQCDGIDSSNEKIKDLIERSVRSQVLSIYNEGIHGRRNLNDYMMQMYLDSWRDKGQRNLLPPGTPIIILENDYRNELFNGDRGIILNGEKDEKLAAFIRSDTVEFFRLKSLRNYETGFAITVHKSQGSEFENVSLFIQEPFETGANLLTRKILYTGITRAKTNLFLIGNKKNIEKCIAGTTHRISSYF